MDVSDDDLAALRRFGTDWGVVLDSDGKNAVLRLHRAGYLDKLKRRTPLYRITEEGEAILAGYDAVTGDDPQPLLRWRVLFSDSPAVPIMVEESERRTEMFEKFRAVAEDGHLAGRKILGMWVVEEVAGGQNVPRAWGLYPQELRARHRSYARGEALGSSKGR